MARTSSYSGKGGIRISVNFSDLLEKIQEAEGDIEAATWEAARKGAKVMRDQLIEECNASGVPSSVSNAITFSAERDSSGNRFACNVGWRMGEYNPDNPSVGHKAVFLNYGTPRREVKTGGVHVSVNGKWVTLGRDRGYIDAKGFIGRAKKKARPKIKKAQKECLKNILKGLT